MWTSFPQIRTYRVGRQKGRTPIYDSPGKFRKKRLNFDLYGDILLTIIAIYRVSYKRIKRHSFNF